MGEHQGIQQVEEKLCSLRPSEEEFEEDVRQWVDPPLAHVQIDLLPGPVGGGIKELGFTI